MINAQEIERKLADIKALASQMESDWERLKACQPEPAERWLKSGYHEVDKAEVVALETKLQLRARDLFLKTAVDHWAATQYLKLLCRG